MTTEGHKLANDAANTEMNDTLSVLPCRLNDVGSQRCWLGPAFMTAQGIQLYDLVQISFDDRRNTCICRAWPRLDGCGDQYVQFDSTVVSSVSHMLPSTISSCNAPIPATGITRLTCSAFEAVSLSVIVAGRKELLRYRRDASGELLAGQLRLLLDGVVLSAGHTVLCLRMTLGKLYSWDSIAVSDVKSSRGSDCGFIAPSTKVTVTGFMSKERFDQKKSSLRYVRLGGLDHEVQLLKDIVANSCGRASGSSDQTDLRLVR